MIDCPFAATAHRLIIVEKRVTAEIVADAIGLSYDQLYARLSGRVAFRPSEARALIAAVPARELAFALLAETPFVPADRVPPGAGIATLLDLTHRVVLEAADLLREVKAGLIDGRIDHRDRARLRAETQTAEAVLASLRLLLEDADGPMSAAQVGELPPDCG
jgi:hypothetical protein